MINAQKICNILVSGIKHYFQKNNFHKAVIGLSGGIDSAVSCCLAVQALGKENVLALLMPESESTSKESIEDAKKLIEKLGIKYEMIAINDLVQFFKKLNKKIKIKEDKTAIANVKARARMMLLYYFANLNKALVIGTSDKSEIMLGYTTKYGDNASDVMPIGDLYKTEVIELGRFLGIPEPILKKKPSPELIKGYSAETELGAGYEVLDKILKLHIEENLSAQEIIKKGFEKRIVNNVIERIRLNEHKRGSPIIIRASERSFHGMKNADNE